MIGAGKFARIAKGSAAELNSPMGAAVGQYAYGAFFGSAGDHWTRTHMTSSEVAGARQLCLESYVVPATPFKDFLGFELVYFRIGIDPVWYPSHPFGRPLLEWATLRVATAAGIHLLPTS